MRLNADVEAPRHSQPLPGQRVKLHSVVMPSGEILDDDLDGLHATVQPNPDIISDDVTAIKIDGRDKPC